MDANAQQRYQLKTGLERLTSLVRSQAWRDEGGPAMHPAQRALLSMLANAPNGLRPGEIAARLGVSAASISDSIRAVAAKGWVERVADPDDARARRLSLTPAGVALVGAFDHPERGLSQLLDALPAQDAAAMLRIVQILIQQAQQQGLASGLRTCLGCEFFRPYASADADQPHVCAFVGAPFGDAALRVDCAEQQPQRDVATLANDVLRFRAGAGA